jgi:hypothetical protein
MRDASPNKMSTCVWRLARLTSGSMRQHTSAYVSIRQHTSAYVTHLRLEVGAIDVRQHASACVSIRQHTSRTCVWRLARLTLCTRSSLDCSVRNLSAYVSIRVSIRQHTSAYVSAYGEFLGLLCQEPGDARHDQVRLLDSIRQHTCHHTSACVRNLEMRGTMK